MGWSQESTLNIVGYALTAVGTLIVSAWTAAWRARGREANLAAEMSDLARTLRKETADAFEAARKERAADIEASQRLTAEAVTAVREKTVQIEMWTRDHLVRQEHFSAAVSRLESRFDKLDDKIEKISDRGGRTKE